MQELDYLTLLSNEPIYLKGIGHVYNPKLKDIIKLGYSNYNLYINMLCFTKEKFIESYKLNDIPEEVKLFDLFFNIDELRSVFYNIFSFFICEKVEINMQYGFLIKNKQDKLIGAITRDNYDDLRLTILQTQYIKTDEIKPVTKISKHAQELMRMRDEGRKKKSQASNNDSNLSLANVVSTISTYGSGINLTNIWDYTVFQLYDQFFRLGYKRQMEIVSMNYACWGGKFDPTQWYLNTYEQQNKKG